MPTYVFRCETGCPTIEQVHPMAAIPSSVGCPQCEQSARRVITAPALGLGNTAAMRLRDATAATAESPTVVSSVPTRSGGGTPVSRDPRHSKLPRA